MFLFFFFFSPSMVLIYSLESYLSMFLTISEPNGKNLGMLTKDHSRHLNEYSHQTSHFNL